MDFDMGRQKAVWQRVYPKAPPPQPRQALAQARRRAGENLRFYESRLRDPIYGPAYEHLANLTRQEVAMLERIK